MLAEDVPKLMSMIPQEEHAYLQLQAQTGNTSTAQSSTTFADHQATPFEYGGVEGINAGVGEADWIVTRSRHEYDETFNQLLPQGGKISGAAAKQEMVKSKLVRDERLLRAFADWILSSLTMFSVVCGS